MQGNESGRLGSGRRRVGAKLRFPHVHHNPHSTLPGPDWRSRVQVRQPGQIGGERKGSAVGVVYRIMSNGSSSKRQQPRK